MTHHNPLQEIETMSKPMTNLQYLLYSFAAALMKAGESLKDSAENVPAGVGNGAPDDDGDEGTTDTTTTGATTATPPEFDSAGLPWDERIHSGAKSIKGDGKWTKRKNTPPTVVATVEAELRAKMGTPGAAAPGVALGLPAATLTPPALTPPAALAPPTLTPPTKYQQLLAYLAANTGPGKRADETWVTSSLAAGNTSLEALKTADDATVQGWLTSFQAALTPAA
jgi:hypothetical protein